MAEHETNQWQPIETAPKDRGRLILLHGDGPVLTSELATVEVASACMAAERGGRIPDGRFVAEGFDRQVRHLSLDKGGHDLPTHRAKTVSVPRKPHRDDQPGRARRTTASTRASRKRLSSTMGWPSTCACSKAGA